MIYQNKDHDVRQIRFRVSIKMHRCKRRVCKRKTLFGRSNIIHEIERESGLGHPINLKRVITVVRNNIIGAWKSTLPWYSARTALDQRNYSSCIIHLCTHSLIACNRVFRAILRVY